MADVNKLRDLLETYGVGVRAGIITPCLQDEQMFRKAMGLSPAPDSVVKDWEDSEGVRRPITLQRPSQTEEGEENKIVQEILDDEQKQA